MLFFFKTKTSYDVRISDWSSDVCSSDLFGRDILLGEVDSRLEMGLRPQNPHPPALIQPPQFAGELALGLASLGRRLGIDQIGDRLDGREVDDRKRVV